MRPPAESESGDADRGPEAADAAHTHVAEKHYAFNNWLAERRPRLNRAGLVEIVNSYEDASATLLWAGQSSLLQEIIEEGARRGITVSIRAVQFSDEELREGAARLVSSADAFAALGFVMTATEGTDASHDGIRILGHFLNDESDPARLDEVREVARTITAAVSDVQIAPRRSRLVD